MTREKVTVGNRLALGMEAALRAASFLGILRCLLWFFGLGAGAFSAVASFSSSAAMCFSGLPFPDRRLLASRQGGDNRLHFALARGQHVSEDRRKQNEQSPGAVIGSVMWSWRRRWGIMAKECSEKRGKRKRASSRAEHENGRKAELLRQVGEEYPHGRFKAHVSRDEREAREKRAR